MFIMMKDHGYKAHDMTMAIQVATVYKYTY